MRAFGLVIVALAACSSSESLPPLDVGDCTPSEAGECTVSIGAAGGGSRSDAGSSSSSTCEGIGPGASQCTLCAADNCCSLLTNCYGETACENLLTCEETCAFASCVTACQAEFQSGAATFNALEACLVDRCPVCSESGVGDPCVAGATICNPGLRCVGGWCTEDCTAASDCDGIGPNGGNSIGQPNACVASPSLGDVCVPGCATDDDCADFPGTFCYSTTAIGGGVVSVCTPEPDASTD